MEEIREIQRDTEGVVASIKRIDADVEDFIFNEAKMPLISVF